MHDLPYLPYILKIEYNFSLFNAEKHPESLENTW